MVETITQDSFIVSQYPQGGKWFIFQSQKGYTNLYSQKCYSLKFLVMTHLFIYFSNFKKDFRMHRMMKYPSLLSFFRLNCLLRVQCRGNQVKAKKKKGSLERLIPRGVDELCRAELQSY